MVLSAVAGGGRSLSTSVVVVGRSLVAVIRESATFPVQLIAAFGRIGHDLVSPARVRRQLAAQAAIVLLAGVMALGSLGVAALVALGVQVVEAGRRVDVEFYRQTAQIIPVLLLGVAIERRAFEWRRLTTGEYSSQVVRVTLAVALLLCVIAGEAVSLHAVAFRAPQPAYFPITVAAVCGLILLLVTVALGFGEASSERPSSDMGYNQGDAPEDDDPPSD